MMVVLEKIIKFDSDNRNANCRDRILGNLVKRISFAIVMATIFIFEFSSRIL